MGWSHLSIRAHRCTGKSICTGAGTLEITNFGDHHGTTTPLDRQVTRPGQLIHDLTMENHYIYSFHSSWVNQGTKRRYSDAHP